jgi:hypothetical protein
MSILPPLSAKSILNDTRVQLEKGATDKFGTAVEDFVKGGGLGFIHPSLNPNTKTIDRKDGSWYATSYAAALAGATNYRPKLKFLFKVEFVFTEEAKKIVKALGENTANDFTFMVKMVDRPKIDFEYEEDLNMYNFRTKALKKIRHRDLTMVFTDDAGNRVFDFVRALMTIHSPITAKQTKRDLSLKRADPESLLHGSGMAFSRKLPDTAHRAAVNSSFGNSIAMIRVKQIFTDPQESLKNTAKMVSYDFMNPRIVSFDFDELSHEANEVSSMTMMFDYDWMEMVNIGPINATAIASDYLDSSYHVLAPGALGAPMDLTPVPGGGGSAAGGGKGNWATDILGGVVGKTAGKLSSDLIGKAVKSVAGNSRLGQALGGQVTSAISGPIGGLVSGASRDAIGSGFSSFSNPFARTSTPKVNDSAGSGSGTVLAAADSGPVTGDGSLNS